MNEDIKKIYTYTFIICIIFGIIGTFIFKEKIDFIKGIVFGTAITILKLRLLHNSLKKAVSMNPQKAHKYAVRQYFIRYFVAAVVLFIAAITSIYMFLGVCLTLLTPKFAIYLSNNVFKK